MEFIQLIDLNKAIDYILAEAKKQKFSQVKLAEDICDVGNLNKIINRKDGRKLNYEYLIKLCEKLNLSFQEVAIHTYFSDINYYHKLELAKKYYYNCEFDNLQNLLEELKSHPDSSLPLSKIVLLMFGALLDIYKLKNYHMARKKCLSAIHVLHPSFRLNKTYLRHLSLVEIEILYYYFLCNIWLDDYDDDTVYCTYIIELLESKIVPNYRLIAKYNLLLAIICFRKGNYDESIKFVQKGITNEKSSNELHIMPYLYYTEALNLYHLHQYDQAMQSTNAAISILNFYYGNHINLKKFNQLKETLEEKLQVLQ